MKKFRELLLAGIDEDIHGTTIERLIKVKQTFEAEMIYNGKKATPELLTQWLQGLPWAVHVPYMNDDIVKWYEEQLGRQAKEHKCGYRNVENISTEDQRWIEEYWPTCGKTLYEMLYKEE